MSELAEAVKYIPGSKNLVFFSSRNPGSNVARLFAAANAPVYAVNTKNWIVHGIINRSIKKKHVYHEHPLKDFAEASGGSYFADIEDVETIAEEINLLSGNYYVLGYYVDEKWDGRFNRIKIEVRRSDVRVLAQDGYFNPKPFAELTEIEKKLHFYDLAFADPPASSPLDLQIEAFCSRVPEKANVMVLTRLQVNEHLGVPPAEAEVFILILAEDQQILSAERGDLDLSTCDGRTFFSYVTKNLKPGAYECRVVIRELAMGRSLVGRAAFSVPSPGGMALSTPLLLRPDAGAEFLRFSIGKKKADAVSLLHFFPYLPRNSTPLLGEIERDTRGLWLLVPISRKSGGSADLDLDLGLIRDSEAGTIPLDWSVIDVKRARPGTDFYLVGITLPSLSPGDYRLKVTAVAAETGERASVSMFLTIR